MGTFEETQRDVGQAHKGGGVRTLLVALGLLVVVVALAGGAIAWLLREEPGPKNPRLTFADGTTIRYLGVTVGTNHVQGTPFARTVQRLPIKIGELLKRSFPKATAMNTLTTPSPEFVVWIEHFGPTARGNSVREVFLRSAGGRDSGESPYLSLWNAPTNAATIANIRFKAWPRVSTNIECAFYESGNGEDFDSLGSFTLSNPALVAPSTNAWLAMSLPATNSVGDIEVVLRSFASGLGINMTAKARRDGGTTYIYSAAEPGREPGAAVSVQFNSPHGTNETWIVFDADFSDHSGSTLSATSRSFGSATNMVFYPVLWDEGGPWKVRLHLKRMQGFTPEELLMLSNVPLPAVGTTNIFRLTNSVKGVQVVLDRFVRRPDNTNRSWSSSTVSQLGFLHPGLGKRNQLDLINITAQPAGTNILSTGASWSEGQHDFEFRTFPEGTTHLDLTVAVQPTRFAEFIVDPNWQTNEYSSDPE